MHLFDKCYLYIKEIYIYCFAEIKNFFKEQIKLNRHTYSDNSCSSSKLYELKNL